MFPEPLDSSPGMVAVGPSPAMPVRSALSELASQAETLHERLQRKPGHGPRWGSGVCQRLLTPWSRAFSRGDYPALGRRLDWDGWEPSQAASAFAPCSTACERAPAWVDGLERYVETARIVAEEIAADPEGHRRSAALEVPFADLWEPWLRVAASGLTAIVEAELGTEARAGLASQLVAEIARLSELAAQELFERRRGDSPIEGCYRRFILDCLDDPLGQLYSEFPVLARRSAETARQWHASVRELASRLAADREAIAETFAGGRPAGRVVAVGKGLSDRHDDGRQVRVLTFASGLRLVYKPREVDLEWAFGEWLEQLRRRGLALAPHAPRILRRSGWGWVELVGQEALASAEQAADYHRRAGALVAVADALRGRDLHVENVVATREGPVVIDAEMLLQPELVRFTTTAESETPAGTCLDSSLLTLAVEGEPERDLAGLRPTPQRLGSGSLRRWRQLGGDDQRVEAGEPPAALRENAAWLGETLIFPESHRREIVEGYEHTYRFLLEHRDEMLAEDGPLRLFEGTRTRLVLRRTQEYSTVLELMTRPRNQRSGLAPGLLCEALLAPLAGSLERPPLWPLVAAERTALCRGDVPRFTVPVGSVAVPSTEGGIEGHLAVSGLDAVRARIAALSEADLSRQLDLLDRALTPTPPLLWWGGRPSLSGIDLAAELLAAASAPGGRTDGWTLERGPLGLALLGAAAARLPGGERLAGAVGKRLETFRRELEPLSGDGWLRYGLGGFSGLGSLLYGLGWLGLLLEERWPIELGLRAARALAPEVIAADRRFDVEGGAAGALLGLLTLYDLTGEPSVLACARGCGRHLVAHQRPCTAGAAWSGPSGLALAGFAHGAAGIARALAALARVSQTPELEPAIHAALAYERSLYDPLRRNWPILARAAVRRDGETQHRETKGWSIAWCHGAPGIALSRLYLSPEIATPELEPALTTTTAEKVGTLDHLCCGTLGRSSVLLTAAFRSGERRWAEAARELAAGVLERAQRRGWFCLDRKLPGRGPLDLDFLKGLSGVAWQLLRLEAGAELPDVLALESPGEQRMTRRVRR